MKQIRIENIQPKPYKRGRLTIQPEQDDRTVYNAIIVPRESIRIFGHYGNVLGDPKPFDRVFKVGDTVEYASYNLTYTGTITAIGASTVTVRDGREVRRLDLDTFCFRNWDFDLKAIQEKNAAWSD